MPYKNPLDERARAARRRYYEKNKQQYRDRNRQYRTEVAQMIRAAKEQACTDCGVKYPYYVMDFDHVRGEKGGGLACATRLGWRPERVAEEMAKCDVVCSNCHRIRTWQRASEAEVAGVAPTLPSTGFDS